MVAHVVGSAVYDIVNSASDSIARFCTDKYYLATPPKYKLPIIDPFLYSVLQVEFLITFHWTPFFPQKFRFQLVISWFPEAPDDTTNVTAVLILNCSCFSLNPFFHPQARPFHLWGWPRLGDPGGAQGVFGGPCGYSDTTPKVRLQSLTMQGCTPRFSYTKIQATCTSVPQCPRVKCVQNATIEVLGHRMCGQDKMRW